MVNVIKPMEDDLSFTVPLSPTVHQQAQEIAERQPNPARFKQAYLNVLAVKAMEQYFDCLGLSSDVTRSRYRDPVLGLLSNSADLILVGLGAVECCPVLDGASVCLLSPETWNNSKEPDDMQRLGYVAVQLAEDLRSASPVGFLPQVSASEIPLTDWQSLEVMLNEIPQPGFEPEIIPPGIPVVSKLSQWLNGQWEQGWQTLESLMDLQQPQLAFRNNVALASPPDSEMSLVEGETTGLMYDSRAKRLNLVLDQDSPNLDSIALLVGVTAEEAPTSETYKVLVKLFSVEAGNLLPPKLTIQVLDEDSNAVMQAEARQTSEIQMEFKGQVSECFSLKINLGDAEQIEAFQI